MEISKTLAQVRESDTIAFANRVHALRRSGIEVVSMVAGELDEPSPDAAKAAGRQAIDENKTRYTHNAGLVELREAICAKLSRDNALNYAPEQIIVSNGAKQSMFNMIFALCSAGDEVIIFSPYWPTYPQQVKLTGAVPVIVETHPAEGFQIDERALRAACSPRTKLIIVNTPNNPTGAVYSRESLATICRVATEYDCWILTDEIYEKLVYPPAQHLSPVNVDSSAANRTIVVNGFSKSFAMTGWRIGYCAGPKRVIDAAATIQSHSTSNACSVSQYAGLAALSEDAEYGARLAPKLMSHRDAALNILNSVPGVTCTPPQGAYYLFPDLSRFIGVSVNGAKIASSDDLSMFLLNDHHVAVVPGSGFGSDRSLRISFSMSLETVVEGCTRIKAGLEKLL